MLCSNILLPNVVQRKSGRFVNNKKPPVVEEIETMIEILKGPAKKSNTNIN